MTDQILMEVQECVAVITLNRPDRLNAVTIELLEELRLKLKTVIADRSIRAMLLKANGRGFCAGLDLTAPRSTDTNPGDPDEIMRDYFNPVFALLKELRVPTIALVNGVAIGAGLSLALSCDVVVAGRSGYFMAGFTNIGLVPDTGASWLLHDRLGGARATGMLLFGERVTAEQAEAWGMIWKCVEDVELEATGMAMAAKLASGATFAFENIKQLMREAGRNSYRDQIVLEASLQAVVRKSEDVAEARVAFREKRKPVFKGR